MSTQLETFSRNNFQSNEEVIGKGDTSLALDRSLHEILVTGKRTNGKMKGLEGNGSFNRQKYIEIFKHINRNRIKR